MKAANLDLKKNLLLLGLLSRGIDYKIPA